MAASGAPVYAEIVDEEENGSGGEEGRGDGGEEICGAGVEDIFVETVGTGHGNTYLCHF